MVTQNKPKHVHLYVSVAVYADVGGLCPCVSVCAYACPRVGSVAAVGVIQKLMGHFYKLPDCLGKASDLAVVADHGRCV